MKQYSGFTLVELIVVITILAILGTIGFISLTKQHSYSRDSVREKDIANMSKILRLNIWSGNIWNITDYISTPLPNNVMWSWKAFGEDITSLSYEVGIGNPIKFNNETFTDPKSQTPYPIAIIQTKEWIYYQVAASLESGRAAISWNYFQGQSNDLSGIIKTPFWTQPVVEWSTNIPY